MRTMKLGSFAPGVNNRLPPTQLGSTLADRSRATFLYAGENVDINARGYLRRRRGFAEAISGPGAHSVWGDGDEGYVCVGTELLHLAARESGLHATQVLADLPESAPISYERMPDGDVVWSNGSRIGRLRGATALPLVTPRPAVTPAAAVIAGALPAGRYQVAFTELSVVGESGSTVPQALDVPANGGIRVTGLGSNTMVYMTGPNGSVFTGILPDGGDIVSLSNNGPHLQSLLLADIPPGQIVRHYKGSLLVARGRYLCVSEPYYYGLTDPARRYIPFPAHITVMEPCEAGVFVCADRTYLLPGGLDDTGVRVVLPYGGLAGSGGRMPTSNDNAQAQKVFWLSPRGLVIGLASGEAVAVQESALKFGRARAGATLYREQDGANHILASRQEAARPTTAADAFHLLQSVIEGQP